MRLTFARMLAAAWGQFRRGRGLITALVGPFLFLPNYALLLLCEPIPQLPASTRDRGAMQGWLARVEQWATSNGGWYLLADAAELFGLAAIAVLLLAPGRLTVRQALGTAARRYLPFAAASILAGFPVALGLWLLVLPGLYAQARLIATLPVLAAEPECGVGHALRRSLRVTRSDQLALTGAVVTLFLVQWFAVGPLVTADEWLRGPGQGNPVPLALIDAALAGLGAAWRTALLLVGVVIYRARVSRGT